MKKFGAALLIYLGLASAALAQQLTPPTGAQGIACAFNTVPPSIASGFFGLVQCDALGRLIVSVTALAAAPRNFPGCTVGAVSSQCLAAATAVKYLQVQNTSASASIACAFGAAAALNSPGSFQLAAGQSASWGPNTTGVPSGALNCIASAGSTPLYVEWN